MNLRLRKSKRNYFNSTVRPPIHLSVPISNSDNIKNAIDAYKKQQMNHQHLDPTKVMMADMESRTEIARLKQEEGRLRAEVEAFKAQLAFETAKNKLLADQEMAEEKNETDLAIAEMKTETDMLNVKENAKQVKDKDKGKS